MHSTSTIQVLEQPSQAAVEGQRICSILEPIKDRSVYSREIERAVKDWTTYYHLSFQRSVFLRSVRHLIKGRVLEIGAECGALTRFLAETGTEVTAVEPVAERAAAARLRCAGMANVKILEAVAPGSYDVILTRVASGEAADWAQLRSLLDSNGRLIVVAANLDQELEKAGFDCEFGSLFPDYDAPSVVFSSEAFATEALDLLSLFDDRTLRYQRPGYVARDRLSEDTAGGFLVVASLRKPNVKAFPGLAYLYSMNRKAAFAKESVIEIREGKLSIRRHALCSSPESVENPVCRLVLEDERWLAGEAYDLGLSRIVHEEGWSIEQIAAWALPWVQFLRASCPATCTVHGGRTILPENYLDCAPFNLIIEDSGRLAPFDLEYAAVHPLDLECVVFRGLWGALTRQNHCADPQAGNSVKVIDLVLAVMRSLEMDLPDSRVAEFVDWEARLQNQVTGTATRLAASVLRQQLISLLNSTETPERRFVCQLFWRRSGGGYQEQDSAISFGDLTEARQTLVIPIPALPGDVEKLRWDMADRPGRLRVYSLELVDANDDVAWSLLNFSGSSAFRSPHDAQLIGEAPFCFVLAGVDPSVELVANASQLRRLTDGGMMVVDCAWVDAPGV